MNFHIVRTNESLKDICLIYNIDIDEIKQANKHIRIWENLSPGLKIKLPEIPESLALELDDVEPFIEDYYPKLDFLIEEKEIIKDEPINKEISEVKKNVNKFYQYPNYFYPYGYNYPYRGYYNVYKNRNKRK